MLGVSVGLVIAELVLLRWVVSRLAPRAAQKLGWRVVFWVTWPGVVLHHVPRIVLALALGQRLVGWSLRDPNPATGFLGHVRTAHRRPGHRIPLWRGLLVTVPLLLGLSFLLVLPVGGKSLPLSLYLGGTVALALPPTGEELRRSWAGLVVLGGWGTLVLVVARASGRSLDAVRSLPLELLVFGLSGLFLLLLLIAVGRLLEGRRRVGAMGRAGEASL